MGFTSAPNQPCVYLAYYGVNPHAVGPLYTQYQVRHYDHSLNYKFFSFMHRLAEIRSPSFDRYSRHPVENYLDTSLRYYIYSVYTP